MSPFRLGQPVRRRSWRVPLAVGIIILGALAGTGLYWYGYNLQPIDTTSVEAVEVTVAEGMNEAQVSSLLQQKGLIRSPLVYEIHTRLSGKIGKMQSGTYKLSKSMSVADISSRFTAGAVALELVTILPAQRLDQIKESFKTYGYSEEEIEAALDPSVYDGHPALQGKPALATLEGYLYPESFQIANDTPLKTVIESSLDEMNQALNNDLKRTFKRLGLSVHDAITLASIVEREVSSDEDRKKAAQVFLKRLQMNMPLGSDPTALYGALLVGKEPSVFADTAYNTRLYAGLPPGPINNVSINSLKAVADPANTDFLYFVSGDDGITRFSKTLQEHEALTAKYCVELCKSY